MGGQCFGAVGGEHPQVSRSASRDIRIAEQKADKSKHLSVSLQKLKGGVTEEVEASDPRDIAMGMLPDFGWSSDQFSCLDSLYMHESGWNPAAHNPSSGAHGIPQSLPGDKMAVYGADWYTNPETQLEWGLHYIQDRYGSPCGAWGFWQATTGTDALASRLAALLLAHNAKRGLLRSRALLSVRQHTSTGHCLPGILREGHGWVMLKTSRAASSWSVVRSPRST